MTNKPAWSPNDWKLDDQWIDVTDAAKKLNCCRATIYRWCDEGKLPTMPGVTKKKINWSCYLRTIQRMASDELAQ
ncbi:helix-turn-helix domain-containing protein [Alicyclobacillus fastidiosus]|uniref:Helix-turn-helix domain-containing protein n=1 Tax=Alicyclobacillus fastidiosus TaxID=392011 RepID=A0ABV5AJ74_9BACL|nr:helix-turn-helix domain-containing protein [Alicyclobacillus fastidiosus]WEH09120.1 helix-turn-helix domain-containing protein [Alicyclobacillus fastidiosus]